MEESREIRVMRNMAWERAKGELRSMLTTYYEDEGNFDQFKRLYRKFITAVEDNGFQE